MRDSNLKEPFESPAGLTLAEREEQFALRRAIVLVAARARTIRATGEICSPCISVCHIGASTGLCSGCFRTRDEIACWSAADDGVKRVVWAMIEQRMSARKAGSLT
jgi:predicted Fe-S protein YdhL (DUF1289 family)